MVFFLPVDDGHRGISPVRNEHESLGTASQQDVEVTPGKNFPRSGSHKDKLISPLSHKNFYLPHPLTYQLLIILCVVAMCAVREGTVLSLR